MLQLVRVDDRAHALDLALRNVEDHDADQAAVTVENERTGLSVHLLAPQGDAPDQGLKPREPRRQRARHPVSAVERPRDGGCLAASVAVEHHVVGQQFLQPLEIPLLGGREEAVRERVALLARGLESDAPTPPLLHVAAGPRHELAGVLRARTDDLRDPVVRLVEHLVQQERGPLLRRQALEQHQEGERHRVRDLGLPGGIVVGARHERLREPLTHVGLAPNPRRAEMVEREP